MFKFFCRFCVYDNVVRVSPTCNLYFLQNPSSFLSLRFNSNTSNQHPFAVSYLVSSCGFPMESALLASKSLHFETPDRPDSVIRVFEKHGFSRTQISKILQKHPRLIVSKPEQTLLPKLEFLQSKGFSATDLDRTLAVCPYILSMSLENRLVPNFDFICNFLKSEVKAIQAIKHQPYILHNITGLKGSIKLLRDNGVPDSRIALFLGNWPSTLRRGPNHLKGTVMAVKEMGFDPLKSQFIVALRSVVNKSRWERKVELYKSWGWSEKEVFAAFGKNPWCMLVSDVKITAMMNFFVNEMGWKSSVIAEYPQLISASLEKKIIPRAAIFQFLLSNGLIMWKPGYFCSLCCYTERFFLKRFVNRFKEAPMLLKLYEEKLNPSK